jgi:hypothetical protein
MTQAPLAEFRAIQNDIDIVIAPYEVTVEVGSGLCFASLNRDAAGPPTSEPAPEGLGHEGGQASASREAGSKWEARIGEVWIGEWVAS